MVLSSETAENRESLSGFWIYKIRKRDERKAENGKKQGTLHSELEKRKGKSRNYRTILKKLWLIGNFIIDQIMITNDHQLQFMAN